MKSIYKTVMALGPLSQMGSGVKTIILVLLNLLVVPARDGVDYSNYVFGFEDLENNLHPSFSHGTGANKAKLIYESMKFANNDEALLKSNDGETTEGGLFYCVTLDTLKAT